MHGFIAEGGTPSSSILPVGVWSIRLMLATWFLFITAECQAVVPWQYFQEEQQEEASTETTDAQQDSDKPQTASPRESNASYRYKAALKVLKHQNIQPQLEDLRLFFEKLQPDHPSHRRDSLLAKDLVSQLASDTYRQRRDALQSLKRMANVPLDVLVNARESQNPETAALAEQLADYLDNRPSNETPKGITKAVCQVIVHDQIKGLANEVMLTLSLFEDEKVTTQELGKAMLATVTEKDLPMLDEWLANSDSANVAHKIIVIDSVVTVRQNESIKMLHDLEEDSNELIRLPVVRHLANFGEASAVQSLLSLMASDDLQIRLEASKAIQSLTRQNFKYYAFEKQESREKALARWQEWLANQSEGMELHFPLEPVNNLLGRILLSDYSTGKVLELNMEGEVIWDKVIANPWGVKGLPNGHRLVGLYTSSEIVEFDNEGQEVWRLSGLPDNPMGFDIRENGNLVIACSTANKIVEYDREKNEVWSIDADGRPCDVQCLENGNVLVALMTSSEVVEFDASGERVWSIDTIASPLHVQRTDVGSTLVTGNSDTFAIEYDSDGEEQRKIPTNETCTSGQRLPNGSYILTTQNSLLFMDEEGEQKWKHEGLTYSFFAHGY